MLYRGSPQVQKSSYVKNYDVTGRQADFCMDCAQTLQFSNQLMSVWCVAYSYSGCNTRPSWNLKNSLPVQLHFLHRNFSCHSPVFQTCISRSGWRLRRIPAPVSPFFPELPCTIFNPGLLSVISSELLDIGKTFNLLSRTSLLSPAFTRIREEIFWMWSTLSLILKWSSTVFSSLLSLFWSRSCSKKCANCIFSGLILCCSSLFLFLCVVESIREVASSILSLAPWLWVWMCT